MEQLQKNVIERLTALGLTLVTITCRYDDNYWDESLRGAACLYVEEMANETIVSNAWPVYVWPDGRVLLSPSMPAAVRAVFEE
jgi:hypothetical protein